MRIVLLVFALLISVVSTYGQVMPPPEKTSEEILEIGKSQTTAGWITGVGGLALIVAGAATHQDTIEQWYTNTKSDNTMSTMLVGLGSAAMIGSVFFFVAGHRNKDKAAYLELTSHVTQTPKPDASGTTVQPGLSLKVRF